MKNVKNNTSTKVQSSKVSEKLVNKTAEKKQFKTSIFTVDFYKGIEDKPNKMKKQRSRSRKANERLYNTIFLNDDKTNLKTSKQLKEYKESKECKELINSFTKRYKADYILNDLSLKSLYSGKDELKTKELSKVLEFIKSFLSEKKTIRKTPTKKNTVTNKTEETKEQTTN